MPRHYELPAIVEEPDPIRYLRKLRQLAAGEIETPILSSSNGLQDISQAEIARDILALLALECP